MRSVLRTDRLEPKKVASAMERKHPVLINFLTDKLDPHVTPWEIERK
jgi:hypothetical protein